MRLNILPRTEEDSRDTPISTKSGSRNDRESKNLISKLCEPRTPRKCLKKSSKNATEKRRARRSKRNVLSSKSSSKSSWSAMFEEQSWLWRSECAAPDDQGVDDDEHNERSSVWKRKINFVRPFLDENLDSNAYQPALSSDLVSCILHTLKICQFHRQTYYIP